jgi:beta-phosphoglucomutase-like phosphatase (HAD superfamily)
VDGIVAARDHLRGKPEPDTFLAAARELGVTPEQAAVFEDAVAGVQAGAAGRFGAVVGVDRVGHADELHANGASIVVKDLSELLA